MSYVCIGLHCKRNEKNIHRQTLTIQQVYGTPHASGPGAEQLWYMFTCQSEYSFPPQHLNWKNKSRSSKTTYQWKYQHSFGERPLFLVKLVVFSSSTAKDLLRLCCGRTQWYIRPLEEYLYIAFVQMVGYWLNLLACHLLNYT